jgi:predicted O-methyltransferase YrrM
MSILRDPELEHLLAVLHAESDRQAAAIASFDALRTETGYPPGEQEIKTFRREKLVALDRDKAEFCYQLYRANDARRIIEIGTSHGVSTLYLAAAVRDNVRLSGGDGQVVGTEYEPDKVRAARANFKAAGLSRFIDLREGDLHETLKQIEGPVDFVLVDIWIAMARPALEMIAPHLRPGAIVLCDNTGRDRSHYADYFAFLEHPANRFRTMTLPFDGGLEMSVYCG